VTDFGVVLRDRRVFLTGHTGFKGSWLTWWLHLLGAKVTGFALEAEQPSMYRQLELDAICQSIIGDVRDRNALAEAVAKADPEFVFHLAAQPLVLESYRDPLGTIATNIVGTANLLDVLRVAGKPVVAVIVTSDKCYENDGRHVGFREGDPLGGHDIYSMSKGAAELVVSSYRRSFFDGGSIRVGSARAGNVIGGGDWAESRLIPDCIRALIVGRVVSVRNPRSVRPWQHVIEPLRGYLLLALKMAGDASYCGAWNFGPADEEARSVEEIVRAVIGAWGEGSWAAADGERRHEAAVLRLNIDKARERLGWQPRWTMNDAVDATVAWYKAQQAGASRDDLRALTGQQIADYLAWPVLSDPRIQEERRG
jgi:CDP-glucose 4,6-dehydratase